MPLRQVKDKWYWGTQGPFDSKKKAQEVARAAHSSGYTKKSSDKASPGSRPMGDPYLLTADELNRKLHRATREGKVLQKYGVQNFGNPQVDALKRGAKKPKGWKRENDDTSMDKLRAFVKFDQQRSTNHPAYPSTFQGKLGAKRIDWRKKKDPNFEKHTRVGTPTDSVYQSSMNTNLVLAKEIWIQKFMDVSRQRVIEYILKEAEEEEPKEEKPPKEEEPTELDEATPTEENIPTEEPTDKPTPVVDKPVTVAGALQWDTARMGPMPKDRVEIPDADHQPKGTQLIEGEREGLYYIGDPTASVEIEHLQYGDEFNKLRKDLIAASVELEQADSAYEQTRLELVRLVLGQIFDVQDQLRRGEEEDARREGRDPIPFPPAVTEYNGELITLHAGMFDTIFDTHIENNLEYKEKLRETREARFAFTELQKQIEPKQVNAINTLLELMQHIPQVVIGSKEIDNDPDYNIQMSPDLQLTVDSNQLYSKIMSDFVRRETLLDFIIEESLPSVGGKHPNLTRESELSFEHQQKFRKRFLDAHQAQVIGKELGAVYLNAETARKHDTLAVGRTNNVPFIFKEKSIVANPYHMKGLFTESNEQFLQAMQILTHEAIHSARDDGNATTRMQARLESFVHPIDGQYGTFNDLLEHPAIIPNTPNYANRLANFHKGTQRFHLFRNEAHTELMAQLVMNNQYNDPSDGPTGRSAATKEDAAKMPLPGGDIALGYGQMMPIFCRWLLMQNGDSPLKAREYFMKSYKGFHESNPNSINASLLDYLHFQAVGSLAVVGLSQLSPERMLDIASQSFGARSALHMLNAFHALKSSAHLFGILNTRAWADGEKGKGQGGQDMKDFINLRTSIGEQNINSLINDPPSIHDLKWFLYGERN